MGLRIGFPNIAQVQCHTARNSQWQPLWHNQAPAVSSELRPRGSDEITLLSLRPVLPEDRVRKRSEATGPGGFPGGSLLPRW